MEKWQGGDMMKMHLFADALRELGHEVVEVCPADKIDYRKFDVIHSYNINYPWTRYFMKQSVKYEKPFVISTIHFDTKAKLSKSKQIEHVKHARKLVMFSPKEKNAIEDFLKIKIPNLKSKYLINGVNSCFKNITPWNQRDIFLLMVVNEYHPRKNIIRAMDIANDFRLGLIIIGRPNPLMEEFNRKCLISSQKFVKLIQQKLTHEQLVHFYNRSKVVLCIGTEDPFPNPVYEATECGCNVAVSNTTYVNIQSGNILYVNPMNKAAMGSVIIDLIRNQKNRVEFPSYKEQAQELVKMYEEII